MEINFWSQLKPPTQQHLLAMFLRAENLSDVVRAQPRLQLWLNEILQVEYQQGTAQEKIFTLENFVTQLNFYAAVWHHVLAIKCVASGYLEIIVDDHRHFLYDLRRAGFAVNSWMEKVGMVFGHGHKFDSARARTKRRFEPQLHLVNDRADEPDFGPNYFFVHWDAQSVFAAQSSILTRLPAGLSHRKYSATPEIVAAYLAAELKQHR